MSCPRTYDWEAVIALWAEGLTAIQIKQRVGMNCRQVYEVVARYRAAGDSRATRHPVGCLGSAFWTDEKAADLAKLWTGDAISASDIAVAIGARSKGAVIGKAHRLRLPTKKKAPVKRHVRARSHAAKLAFVKPRPRPLPRPRPALGALEPSPIETPVPVMLSIMELTNLTCKFPSGDPRESGFGFCGHPVKPDKPYCPYHCGVAYQPYERRSRRKFVVMRPGTFEAVP